MKNNILIIEDEDVINMTICDRLEAEGYTVKSLFNGKEGFETARQEDFDVILLDVMLPDMDGFTVCSRLRQENIDTPIIMLTAKCLLTDKVQGLKMGADDYLTKPFEMPELLARIEVQIRRSRMTKPVQTKNIKKSSVTVDLKRGFVTVNGNEQLLIAQEIKLLEFFYQHQGEIVSREELLKHVWGYDSESISTRTIDVHIAKLRQKLGEKETPKYIQTIRGIGYRFIAP